MLGFGSNQDKASGKWRVQLDYFVEEHEVKLAALAWGLQQEWQDSEDTLGIDLQPQPHFVACGREAIEKLNRRTRGHLQEILGLIDGYQPEIEVLILAIAEGQVKLINFQPEISPPECFAQLDQDLDSLIASLEKHLEELIQE